MKTVIVIPDGCADEPLDALGGRTPLEAARIPAMDAIARTGIVGRASHVPAHLPAGSDVANMSLLGYDPTRYFSGRAPLEAAAQGISLGADDWAVRCNLVTVEDGTMRSFTAGHISSDEARALLATAAERTAGDPWEFVPGVSYRNLALWRGAGRRAPFTMETRYTPPHDLTDRSILDDYPRGPGSDLLLEIMERSGDWFADHPVNVARRAAGKLPATHVWLWGLGRTPALPSFAQRYGVRGAMITAVDLLRGLAALVGWERIEVPGATGYLDTDYAAKGRAAVAALGRDEIDLICVHVEATDEASHEGRVDAKIEALQRIDADIVAPLRELAERRGDIRILITPDHPTPIRLKTHSHGAVPFALAGPGISADGATSYDERQAARSESVYDDGWKLMGRVLDRPVAGE